MNMKKKCKKAGSGVEPPEHTFLLAAEGRLLLRAIGPLGALRVHANAEGATLAESAPGTLAELTKVWLYQVALDHATEWHVAGVSVTTVGTEIRVEVSEDEGKEEAS